MFWKIISGVVFALTVMGSVSAQTILRYAEGGPNRGTRAEAMEYFIQDVKKLTDGSLDFEMHWGGSLVDFRTTANAVSSGAADIGTVLAAYTPTKTRALLLGDVPTGYSDPWVGMRAMYELMTTNKELENLLARENLAYVTGYSSTGVQLECRGKDNIQTVADIKGKRMRAIGNYAKVLKDLGASMVNVTIGDFYQALDTGLIDCNAGYLYVLRAYKTYEVVDHVTLTNWGQITGFATLINRDVWGRLSDEQRRALREAGSSTIDYFAKLQIDEMNDVVDGLRTGSIGKKVSVYEMPEQEREKLLKAGEKYAHDWVATITKEGVDGEKIWGEYQELLRKYQDIRDVEGYPWEH